VIVGLCVLKLRLETVQAEAAHAVGLPPIVTSSRQRSASPDPRDGRDKSSGSGGSGGGRARGLGAARSNLSGGSGDEWWRRCFLLPGKTCCRAVLLLRLEFSFLQLRRARCRSALRGCSHPILKLLATPCATFLRSSTSNETLCLVQPAGAEWRIGEHPRRESAVLGQGL